MMVTEKFLVLKAQFDVLAKRLLSNSLYGNMVGVVESMWVLVRSYVFFVFGIMSRYILRFQADDQRNRNCSDLKRSWSSDIDVNREQEALFDSPDSKRDDGKREETENFGFVETVSAASTDLYEFRSAKDVNGYMEEPKGMSFIVQELYVGWSNSSIYDHQKGMSFIVQEEAEDVVDHEKTEAKTEDVDDQQKTGPKTEAVDDQQETEPKTEAVDDQEKTEAKAEVIDDQEKAEDFTCNEEVLEKTAFNSFSFGKGFLAESELSRILEHQGNTSFGEHDPSDEAQSLVEDCGVLSDSEAEAVTSRKNHDMGSITYEFLVGRNVSEGQEPQGLVVIKEDDQTVKMNMEDFQLHELGIPSGKRVVFADQHEGFESSDDEYIEISEPQMQHSSALEEKVENQHEDEDELVQDDETQPTNDSVQSAEEIGLQERTFRSILEDEDEEELEWEREDILEQLKMEIRNVRNRRLPTILEEETECANMMENVKLEPLMIDEKLEYKDQMVEIQKVYKSYADKMRKLDILNNQTMHAIGFLQLKDQIKSMRSQKSSSVPIVKSLISQNLWRCKAQRQPTAHDPVPKFVGELHKDFELVYVGQVCLSWEILKWQHRKAQELLQYDHAPGSCHQYNLVAAEFQLFQVLLQRFVEDDPFQGPRVQHYVKNRCVLSSLLQVPSIRDDRMIDKKHVVKGDEDLIILSFMLVKIIEESMRIFWTFIRKDERNAILKGLQETHVDHKDLELVVDIRKDLQKKEKKLKDIYRCGSCVVKKFQKHQQDRLEHALLVAQVELRLISRVLNMSKLKTEQLVWCHEKLGKINFVHRKVRMEPSFLLFPC